MRSDLRVAVGGGPELKTLSKLFDGESWSLFRHGDGYCLALNPSVSGVPPAWVACVDRDFTEGTVFCDEMLVRDNDGVRGIVNPILHRLDQLLTMYILARRRGILVPVIAWVLLFVDLAVLAATFS